MKKNIKIKCWVAVSEEGEFMVGATKKEAIRHKYEAKSFDIEMKIRKAVLIIN